MSYLYLTVLLPVIGFILLAGFRDQLSETVAKAIGVGALGLSFAAAVVAGVDFLSHKEAGFVFSHTLWNWMTVGSFNPGFSLRLDGLSLTMTGIITGVGFLIHVFASWYMHGDTHFARFFSYLNLFVASMLLLVLADNLVLLYLGWEGVGLCSYLLIGFYYKDPANGFAAIKAFTVTRVGDVFLAIALFLLYRAFGTLNIHEIITRAPDVLQLGSFETNLIALMLLGGAVGKSAQIPLQTWLADAMAGPTPVSALIHAATMVTAGVYLIARLHPVFLQAPAVHELVAAIGAMTLLISGFSALVQTDIKRVLAYSTMSQIGYMFLALGVSAWQAAIFHLMTHAFFKALLFLSSGAVILAAHHEQNIFNMGGLRSRIPFVWLCFLVGGGALAALPFVTIGFYSKDEIIWQTFASGHPVMFWAAIVGAFMTSLYTFRLIYLVFHGEAKAHHEPISGVSYWLPLAILLVLSTAVGAVIHPPLQGVLPANWTELAGHAANHAQKHFAEAMAIGAGVLGLLFGFFLWPINHGQLVSRVAQSKLGQGLTLWFKEGFGFDALYDALFVKPFLAIAKLLSKDPVDKLLYVFPALVNGLSHVGVKTQTASLRAYVATSVLGIIVVLFIMLITQVMGK